MQYVNNQDNGFQDIVWKQFPKYRLNISFVLWIAGKVIVSSITKGTLWKQSIILHNTISYTYIINNLFII